MKANFLLGLLAIVLFTNSSSAQFTNGQSTAGTFLFKNIIPGVIEKITAKVNTNSESSTLDKKIKLTASSTIDGSLVDVVKAQVLR